MHLINCNNLIDLNFIISRSNITTLSLGVNGLNMAVKPCEIRLTKINGKENNFIYTNLRNC